MAGRNGKTQSIQYVFPDDYKQIDIMLSVYGNKMTLKVNSDNEFYVCPEYDLRYKLLSKMYSKDDRIENISKLFKRSNDTEESEMYFHNHRNNEWGDYMFQFPGTYKMFGITRNFRIGNAEESIKSSSVRNNKSMDKVVQTPILFLILVYVKIFGEAFLTDDIIDLINKAIVAYNQQKESNLFEKEQLDLCYEFLLKGSEYTAFRAWLDDSKSAEIKERVGEIVINYLGNNRRESEAFTHESDKGDSISFPKYMRSILLGIHEGAECLKSISPLIGNKTFWTNTFPMVLKDIESEKVSVFRKFVQYLVYQIESNKLLNGYRDVDMEEFNSIQEKVDKHIMGTLTSYYTFCIYTLYKVSCEKTKYRNLAQDTFERAFSMYLFHIETEILHEKVKELAKESTCEQENSRLESARYVFNCISAEVVHAIYCSPGIYHRVKLAKYIIRTVLPAYILHPDYYKNYMTYSEENMQLLKDKDYMTYSEENMQLLKEIGKINQDYFAIEKEYIHIKFTKNKEITLEDIQKEYESDKKDEEHTGYDEYYQKFYAEIKGKLDKKEGRKKFRKADASKLAQKVIKEMPIEKRLLHFWVILFSFLSEDSLINPD